MHYFGPIPLTHWLCSPYWFYFGSLISPYLCFLTVFFLSSSCRYLFDLSCCWERQFLLSVHLFSITQASFYSFGCTVFYLLSRYCGSWWSTFSSWKIRVPLLQCGWMLVSHLQNRLGTSALCGALYCQFKFRAAASRGKALRRTGWWLWCSFSSHLQAKQIPITQRWPAVINLNWLRDQDWGS